MATPDEAYGKGYEKGRKEGLAGNTAEAIFGMMKDDPGGHHAAGYRDGAAGRKFKPPSAQAPGRKPAADVNPFDDKVAIKAVCPHCGALDWFEWKFLGRLTDPICGQSWYAGSGTYAAMQIRAAFSAGGKGAKYLTSGVSGGEGAWIAKALGWFMGVLLGLAIRLEFGVLMIPIQALAGLFQAKKTAADIVTRVVVLAVTLGGIGIVVYKIQHTSSPQFEGAQPAASSQPRAGRQLTGEELAALPDGSTVPRPSWAVTNIQRLDDTRWYIKLWTPGWFNTAVVIRPNQRGILRGPPYSAPSFRFTATCGSAAYNSEHCCPAKSRTESIGCLGRVDRVGSPMLGGPVKWSFFQKA